MPVRPPRRWIVLLAAALAVAVAAAVAVTQHRAHGATIQPVPHAATPAAEARNLEAWLRRYSR